MKLEAFPASVRITKSQALYFVAKASAPDATFMFTYPTLRYDDDDPMTEQDTLFREPSPTLFILEFWHPDDEVLAVMLQREGFPTPNQEIIVPPEEYKRDYNDTD